MTNAIEETYWYRPTLNMLPEVTQGMSIPSQVELCDLTLDEDGEGMAGAYMTEDEKVGLAEEFERIGIHRIGVLGYPSPITAQEVAAVRRITGLGLKAKCQSLASTREDVDHALQAGVWGIILRKPCSNLYTVTPVPVEQKVEEFLNLAGYTRSQGVKVGLMAQDITRADLRETRELICSIQEQFGLDEICLTDSQGVGTPFSIFYIVKTVKAWMDVPIAVHCHNTLGMATANACAAVMAGAQIVHTTVNGMGHFAGMPPTEEVAVALKIGYGIDLGIHYERLYALSQTVQRMTGVQVQPHKPVVGSMAYSRSEEQKHIQELVDSREKGILKNFYPYLPEFVGGSGRVVMGQKVMRLGVEYNLQELGLQLEDWQIDEIFKRVKELALAKRRIISNAELAEIARTLS